MAIPSWLWSDAETLERTPGRQSRPESEPGSLPSDGDAVSPVAGSSTASPSPRDGTRSTARTTDEGTTGGDSVSSDRLHFRPDSASLEDLSSDFDALANPIRLEILSALARCEGPLRYSELRTAISIEDNGKLNYHLRTLEDLVTATDGAYRLTARGRDLVGRVLDGSVSPDTRTNQDR